jgi:hypothetical protein
MMTWTIKEVISDTLRAFGRNWKALVLSHVIAFAIVVAPLAVWAEIMIPTGIAFRNAAPEMEALAISTFIMSTLAAVGLAIMFAPALSRIALAATRDQRPRLGDLFTFDRVGTFFVASLLTGLAISGGTLLFVVPGIIVALGLSLVSFFVVDGPAGVSASDALRASWNATRGHRRHILGLLLLVGLTNMITSLLAQSSLFLLPLAVALMVFQPAFTGTLMAVLYGRLCPRPIAADGTTPVVPDGSSPAKDPGTI